MHVYPVYKLRFPGELLKNTHAQLIICKYCSDSNVRLGLRTLTWLNYNISKVSLRTTSGGGQVISGRILRLWVLIDLIAMVPNRGQLYPLLTPFCCPRKGIFGSVWRDFWLSQLGQESC